MRFFFALIASLLLTTLCFSQEPVILYNLGEEGSEGLVEAHQVNTESLRVRIEELLQEAGQ